MNSVIDELLLQTNIAFAIFNSELNLIQKSKNLSHQLILDSVNINDSLYDICPEFFGFEKEIAQLLSNQKKNLCLEKINKYKPSGEIEYLDFLLVKISNSDNLLLIITNNTTQSKLEQKVQQQENEIKILKESISYLKSESLDNILGESDSIKDIKKFVIKVANLTKTNILLTGESGTGKTLVARAIHNVSKNSKKPFIEINCATIPSTLIESEIFGHVKGSFTNAFETKKGLLEVADGGTLFLDEIGELPFAVQPKLLTFLETKKFRQVGSTKEINANVRIICATNKDLQKSVKQKEFREDLFYRINVVTFHIPALREHSEDIPIIAKNFIREFASDMNKQNIELTKAAENKLLNYSFPGNIRELKNLIERAVIFCEKNKIDNDDLMIIEKDQKITHNQIISIPEEGMSLVEIEKKYLNYALHKSNGNQTKAAKLLGLSLDTFRYRIKKYNIME